MAREDYLTARRTVSSLRKKRLDGEKSRSLNKKEKNLYIFRTFWQKYLQMSKKSITFAAKLSFAIDKTHIILSFAIDKTPSHLTFTIDNYAEIKPTVSAIVR